MQYVRRAVGWFDPVALAAHVRGRDWPLGLIAGGADPKAHGGQYSIVACDPDRTFTGEAKADLFSPLHAAEWREGPVAGLVSYDAGARVATGERQAVWPDLILARYPAWIVFDHIAGQAFACGWGWDTGHAQSQASRAASWLVGVEEPVLPPAPSEDFRAEAVGETYCEAVAEVVRRIGEGELFQANIARAWRGQLKPDGTPFDVFIRLSQAHGAAYSGWWQPGDRALVSNTPELFMAFDNLTGRLETRPIKGTRPRFDNAVRDAEAAMELRSSAKDCAENLMIVDLMRNDLGRVAQIGSVKVDQLYGLESHPTVHHLTSVVSAKVRAGVSWAEILRQTFPAGSITGAPKHQAMKVIAELEPPRGAWCGTLFVQSMAEASRTTASVLIRTASFERTEGRWIWRALAGAGITADSQPSEELAETEAKILALKLALAGGAVGTGD